ncbi:MAG: Flp pilus assembly protein CpaB [Azoarcus sp.]|nr:Flp pilus assembly protein CpaB [Azoarcus sp.]
MSVGKRRLMLLGVALGMAGLAGLLVKVYLDRKAAELEARYGDRTEKMQVVVPKRDLPAGVRIKIEDFAIRPMQADMVPPDTVLPGDIDRALGQSLKIALPLGRPLLWGYLSSGTNPSFSDLLDENRRALTIAVDELNSISGMIRPYDRIDLFIVGKDQPSFPGIAVAAKNAKIVRPLLQNVLVKATGNIVRRETGLDGREYDRRYSTLTLDLLPDEIGRVLIAQENGELKAALKRPEQDDARYRPTRESDLWGDDGDKGGIVFYIGGRGDGALRPEMLSFADGVAVGGDTEQIARQMLEARRLEEARRKEGAENQSGEKTVAPAVTPSSPMTGGASVHIVQ